MHFSYRKIPQHFHEASEPDMPHWCIVMVPDEEAQTVTFMQGKAHWGLTESEAKNKAAELNDKLDDAD